MVMNDSQGVLHRLDIDDNDNEDNEDASSPLRVVIERIQLYTDQSSDFKLYSPHCESSKRLVFCIERRDSIGIGWIEDLVTEPSSTTTTQALYTLHERTFGFTFCYDPRVSPVDEDLLAFSCWSTPFMRWKSSSICLYRFSTDEIQPLLPCCDSKSTDGILSPVSHLSSIQAKLMMPRHLTDLAEEATQPKFSPNGRFA